MAKRKNNGVYEYKVLTADWWMTVEIDHEIFDDPFVEACTQAIEYRVQNLQSDDDLNVNPVMVCTSLSDKKKQERYINTYKILINAGMPARAELLREIFLENIEVDLAMEPMSASLKRK